MKEDKITMLVLLVIALVGVFTLLNKMEEKNYQNAIVRCGNKNNVVERHTNQGDTYYTCKVEK